MASKPFFCTEPSATKRTNIALPDDSTAPGGAEPQKRPSRGAAASAPSCTATWSEAQSSSAATSTAANVRLTRCPAAVRMLHVHSFLPRCPPGQSGLRMVPSAALTLCSQPASLQSCMLSCSTKPLRQRHS